MATKSPSRTSRTSRTWARPAVAAHLHSDYCRAAARRVPPEVTRDGSSTVRQVVDTVTTLP